MISFVVLNNLNERFSRLPVHLLVFLKFILLVTSAKAAAPESD